LLESRCQIIDVAFFHFYAIVKIAFYFRKSSPFLIF
jgi:hypothetical protein